jgi:3-deoxy-D-manno-octulosonic-acid transferase
MVSQISPPLLPFFYRLYDLAWQAAIPLLRRNQRLAAGYPQRRLSGPPLPAADLWIHAASVGEVYLALEIISKLQQVASPSILVTTNTAEGKTILASAFEARGNGHHHRNTVNAAYFPFDAPSLMGKAIEQIQPRAAVLLEGELWPGMMHGLKHRQIPLLVINGRLSASSLKRLKLIRPQLKAAAPTRILAISPTDTARFATLFGLKRVATMPNIKFDQLTQDLPEAQPPPCLPLPSGRRLVVLGSVREPERMAVANIISRLREMAPGVVIALVPRHIHYLDPWRNMLDQLDAKWILRSQVKVDIKPETVVLWDTIGELKSAYTQADAAFVGGSLAPLGGQNFLEPLLAGIVPVIGPHWDNFRWVGSELAQRGLVRIAANAKAVTALLIDALNTSISHEKVRQEISAYVRTKQGGTRQACSLINRYLSSR